MVKYLSMQEHVTTGPRSFLGNTSWCCVRNDDGMSCAYTQKETARLCKVTVQLLPRNIVKCLAGMWPLQMELQNQDMFHMQKTYRFVL